MVYYRAGYSPDDYPSESEWAARKVLEQSETQRCISGALRDLGSVAGSTGFDKGSNNMEINEPERQPIGSSVVVVIVIERPASRQV